MSFIKIYVRFVNCLTSYVITFQQQLPEIPAELIKTPKVVSDRSCLYTDESFYCIIIDWFIMDNIKRVEYMTSEQESGKTSEQS